MANTTDPFAGAVHGTNPQYLIEKITRQKIWNCRYWKEECFGLTAATVIDKAIELKYCGGTYGGNNAPTKFLCLALKLLQLQPEKDIIMEYVNNEEFKYVRLLGAFYLRLVGKAEEVYTCLEPLLSDYRCIVYRSQGGWEKMHVDEFVDRLIREESVCDVTLPHLIKRLKLEELGSLQLRQSVMDEELATMERLELLQQMESQLSEDSEDDGSEGHVVPIARYGEVANNLPTSNSAPSFCTLTKPSSRGSAIRFNEDSDSDTELVVVRPKKRAHDADTTATKEEGQPKRLKQEEADIASQSTLPARTSKNENLFNRMFGKKDAGGKPASSAGVSGGKEIVNAKGEKVLITAAEGTVEYWNQIRESLGMSKLKS